jgi:hypothetical protein
VWIEGLWITVTKVILMKPKYKFEEKIFWVNYLNGGIMIVK